MDEETILILENQKVILRALFRNFEKDEINDELRRQYIKTQEILNPKKLDPTIQEQTDKSMNRVIKAGQDCPRCGVIGVCLERLQYHNSGRCLPRSKFGKREK